MNLTIEERSKLKYLFTFFFLTPFIFLTALSIFIMPPAVRRAFADQKPVSTERTASAEAALPEHFKNIDNLKFAIKKLKNIITAYATAYNENESQLKNFLSDLISCLADYEISEMEESGLAETLAETIVKLKVMPDGRKRVYDQFIRVMDEALVKRTVSSKIVDDAEKVSEIIIKKDDTGNSTERIIYKYYGVNAKGHAAHKVEKEKNIIRGKDNFFGKNEENADATMQKYNSASQEKGGKIIGMQFMDPVAARESAETENQKNSKKQKPEDIIKEKTDKKTE